MQRYVEGEAADSMGSEGWSWNDDRTTMGVAIDVNGCGAYVRVVTESLNGSERNELLCLLGVERVKAGDG